MDHLNLQSLQFAPDLQHCSQLQLELQRITTAKPNVQNTTNVSFFSLNESMEKVLQMRHNLQNTHYEPQVPQQQMNLMQQQSFQQQIINQVEPSNTMQRLQFCQQNVTNLQPKVIMHPPTYHQNSTQQFHLVQVQVPGKETQLQLIPFQTKSTTTNSEQCASTNRRYTKSSDTVNVSHEYVSQNRQKHQTIYPSYFSAPESYHMPLLKPLPCPQLTSLTPPPFTSQLVGIQKTIVPSTSQLLPLQGISMPEQTQFHQQLSNVINVLPQQNISLEEIDIKPDINEQLHFEQDPSEFLKSFLLEPDVPQQKVKRKRKLKSWEMLLDNDKYEVDDDISHDYVEIKKQKRMSKDEKEEKRAKKVEKNNQKLMDKVRPCSVQLEKLMFTSMDMPVKIVNDNIVKIRMPRMKTVPTNYNKISNIGYIKYPKGIAYKCLSQACRFQSYDEEVFEKHLINHHSQDAISEWTGYCCSCNDFVTAKTLIDEFDHLIEDHLQTTKKVNRKKEQSAEELDAEAILAIKEVLDTFEEIVAQVDSVDEEASKNAVDIASVNLEGETNVIKKKNCTEIIENKIKCRKEKEEKSKVVKEPGTIAGRMINNRRKTIDSREDPLPPRRSSRHSSNVLEDETLQELPSVIVNSSNDGKIKMTIKNPTRFVIDKHKKKKDKKVAKNTFQDPLTPPESSSNCTDSDYSEHSNVDDEITAS